MPNKEGDNLMIIPILLKIHHATCDRKINNYNNNNKF